MFNVIYTSARMFGDFESGFYNRSEKHHYTWKLDQKKPEIPEENIISFSASDEELSHIHQYFRNLPTVSMTKEVIWRGIFAQFIYENL